MHLQTSYAVAIVVCLVVALAVAARYETLEITDTAPMRARDGQLYRVHASLPDSQQAADTLSELNARAARVVRAVRKRNATGRNPAERHAALLLLRRFNPSVLVENSPFNMSRETSYTLDKGALMALCLRGRDGKSNIENIDVLTFVMLHEMAHVATDTAVGEDAHSPKFWATFKWLLEEARAAGVDMTDVVGASRPREYCGMTIQYNPLHDNSRPPLGYAPSA